MSKNEELKEKLKKLVIYFFSVKMKKSYQKS